MGWSSWTDLPRLLLTPLTGLVAIALLESLLGELPHELAPAQLPHVDEMAICESLAGSPDTLTLEVLKAK